jgi:4-alpha-glucanotransferase
MWWQVLPLGPTGHGHTPYGCLSSFAGDPKLISPERLVEQGLLPPSEIEAVPAFAEDRVEFARAVRLKERLLRTSWSRFRSHPPRGARERLDAFVHDPLQEEWLDDWALFSALKKEFGGAAWTDWDRSISGRAPEALTSARAALSEEIAFHRYAQFLFFTQWEELKTEANARGIRILGDVPIYVAHDSADVWARPDLFDLDEAGSPRHVAGVPPDYFSATGQRWGNPIYRWDRLEREGYAWWIARMRANLRIADVVRLDHFRAFRSYWEVPASEKTAVVGRWVPGPGEKLLEAMRASLGALAVIAEDLGTITPDVHALRDAFGLPGMKVLQFGFYEPDSSHHPRHHHTAYVVYTGTHDNDTTRGWFETLTEEQRHRVLEHVGGDGTDIAWAMVRAAYDSEAELAIIPAQDLLGLGSEARMNTPGSASGNWGWRMKPDQLDHDLAERLRGLVESTGRGR